MGEIFKEYQAGLKKRQEVLYPVIQVRIIDPITGGKYFLTSCFFHDLFSSPDHELAGMGLAIIGNLCKALKDGRVSMRMNAFLEMLHGQNASPIPLPWPGMPDDRPIPLDLAKMPFFTEMFFEQEDQKFKYRMNRLELLRRIQEVWVPYLKGKMNTMFVKVYA